MSGNFEKGQGNLKNREKVREMSGNFEAVSGKLCLPPTGSGDILFFPVRLSVCPSQIVSAL